MAQRSKKTCIISFVFLIILIVLAVVFSQWQTNKPKLNLSGFSAKELYKASQQKVKEGDLKEAKKYIEAALEQDAKNVSYLGELAAIKYMSQDYKGAITEYEKIIKEGNYQGFAYNGIANIYRDQASITKNKDQIKQYTDKAYETYQKGIKADPKYVALYSNYAIMLISADKKTEAKKIIEDGIAATNAPELKQLLKTM